MAQKPPKTCRWLIVLAELLPWSGLFVTHAYAGDAVSATAAASISPTALADDEQRTASLGGTDLYLDVEVNGAHSGLAHFVSRDGQLWASLATLRQLGFNLPANTADPLQLSDLQAEGMQSRFDAKAQSLKLTAPLKLLKLDTAIINAPQNERPQASASPGVLLNYNLYGAEGDHDSRTFSAYTELRAFNSMGVFSNTALLQSTDSKAQNWQTHNVRLDSSWTMSFPDSLTTLKFGDTLTGALDWTRSTRIAGVQVGTNFALQPYLITTPLPAFFGSAVLPSAVQLYINGVRQYSGNVPAGPFQLNALPSINGAGTAQVVMTNALGQQTTLNFALYNEQQMLQKGLSDWSAELGLVRQNYGISSFDYGHNPATSGTWRYGVSNTFTADAHGEVTKGLVNGGLGGNWLLGSQGGMLSGSLAASQYDGHSGGQYGLGYSWNNNRFNFSASGTRTVGTYHDVASLYDAPIPRLTAHAEAGYNTNEAGSFGVSYLQLHYAGAESTRYGSTYWFKSFGQHTSINLSYNQNLVQRRDRTLYLLATISLGHNITVSGGVQRENGRDGYVASAMQSLPSQGGFGWRVSTEQQESINDGQAELDYQGRYGQVNVGASSYDSSHYGYASANGAVVLMGGDLFAARQIVNGFAVVSTAGIPNVPIKLENNLVGTTDSHGMLLITPLNAYQNNQVAIDPMDLPADMRLDRVQLMATPTDRSGILVRFGIMPVRAASIILVDAAGKPLPLGSAVRPRGQSDGEPQLVGFDGAVYLDTLQDHNTLNVQTPSGSCEVRFDFPAQNDHHSIPQVGPLRCIAGATL